MATDRWLRARQVLSVSVVVAGCLASTAVSAEADRLIQAQKVMPVSAKAGPADVPVLKPGAAKPHRRAVLPCAQPAEGQQAMCVEHIPARPDSARKHDGASTNDVLPTPQWCTAELRGTRTEACSTQGFRIETFITQNGVKRVTGEVFLDMYDYTYSDTSLPYWSHQLQVVSYAGWGHALEVRLSGQARAVGDCTVRRSSLPSTLVHPFRTIGTGESIIDTTATNPDDIGYCETNWRLTYSHPLYGTGTGSLFGMSEIRCDNATVGNTKTGCVVPWYASALYYDPVLYPTLAAHVRIAQASGLPGATFENPLYRTEVQEIIDENRRLACDDAPSVPNFSCDEYPIATSYQGLSAGGTRRTFDGCGFNLPRATGPDGVSVCMIEETDNHAQGGLNTQFFRRERVLDGDPFRVIVP